MMRTIPEPPEAAAELEQGSCDWFNENAQLCDWKASPETVLESVNFLLERHGLEVVLWDMQDDSYTFQILPRVADETEGTN